MTTVGINPPRTPVTQGSSGIAAATVPNVCKMPGPPAPFIPVPLPNIGMSENSPEGYSSTVTIESHTVAIRGASFGSVGDVASQPTGGGIISSVTQGRTTFLGPGSLDVKIEGRNVHLLGDPMLNNGGPGGSPANAATMAGVLQAPMSLALASTGATVAASPPPKGPELRRIVLAQGKEFQNVDLWTLDKVPEVLLLTGPQRLAAIHQAVEWTKKYSTSSAKDKREAIEFFEKHNVMASHQKLDIKPAGANTYIYESKAQNVTYELKIVTKKSEFIKELLTKDIHVIYDGHARYGRGPCFGDTDSLGEDWEEGFGSHPNDTGLYRMGRPYIGVPAVEIFDHGYTANLVSGSLPLPPSDCDFDGMPNPKNPMLALMRKGTLSEIEKLIPDSVRKKNVSKCPACLRHSEHLLDKHVRNHDPKAQWWYYNATDNGVNQPHFVLHAGWQKTTSTPDDLGASALQCRVFCHFGCTTEPHNREIVRTRAKWQLVNDNHYAFFTDNLSYGLTSALWLQHLFSYDKDNGHQPWKASLEYARRKINVDLKRGSWNYSIV